MKALLTIGYIYTEPKEEGSDIFIKKEIEKMYYADVLEFSNKFTSTDKVNDDFTINNKLSIISDLFALDHIGNIAYIQFLGNKWKVKDVTIQYPRLIISIGGLYNV